MPGLFLPGCSLVWTFLWEVMSQKKCMDVFGTRVGQSTYCIQLKIGNNSGYPLQIAGIGFSPDANPATTGPDTTIANSSYASTRAVLLTENYTNGRNIVYNIIHAIGVLMPAFAPYFGTTHPNGTVNNARVHWSTAASIVSGPLLQAFDIIAPNPVIAQLNQLDDQSFRDNLVIANNVQITTVVFVEKQELTSQLIKLNAQPPNAMVAQENWANLGLDKSTSTMKSTITNSTNNRGMISKKGGFNPYYVKLALGNVVIVGRHIAYLDRVHVVNSATAVSGAAPIISKVSLPDGVRGAVVGTEVTISGSSFGGSKGTVQIGSVAAPDITSWSDTEIKVKVPDGVQPGKAISLTVSAGGVGSAPGTVMLLPSIKGDPSPETGIVRDPVKLEGNFGELPGTVQFGAISAPVQPPWTAKLITVLVPDTVPPGAAGMTVTSADGTKSDAVEFLVKPQISIANPTGVPDDAVKIPGSFGNGGIATLGASTTDISSNWTPSSVTVTVPDAAPLGNADLTITSSDGRTSNKVTFLVKPRIDTASPTGAPGEDVVINGRFGGVKGSAKIGTSGNVVKTWTPRSVTVTVPDDAAPGTVDFRVSSADGKTVSTPVNFKVKPSRPMLDRPSGAIGALITITGKNYSAQPGQIAVTFGKVKAEKSGDWTATSLPVKVPAGVSGAVKVVVTVNGVSSDSADFTVTQ